MRRRDLLPALASAAAAFPFAARAQAKPKPVIGFLGNGSPGTSAAFLAAFHGGLRAAGYVDGTNVTIEYRWAEGDYARLAALAVDLVGRKVDVIQASATPGIAAAKGATATIPIVFFGGDDLVAAGLVDNLARPSGNLTGIGIFGRELNVKRLELLSELVPQAAVIALLVNPNQSTSDFTMRDMEDAARMNGRRLPILQAGSASEIDAAFASLVQLGAGALVVASDPFFNSRREQIVALAARHAIPAIYEWREFADAGGLISYGPSFTRTWYQVGVYVGRVLAGSRIADLPIQRPTAFELVINLKAAKVLDLPVPRTLLARADDVIE